MLSNNVVITTASTAVREGIRFVQNVDDLIYKLDSPKSLQMFMFAKYSSGRHSFSDK